MKALNGDSIVFHQKEKLWKRYLFGGVVFGLGWALTGAYPDPMFTIIGNGYASVLTVIISASFGTFLYGVFQKKLPH